MRTAELLWNCAFIGTVKPSNGIVAQQPRIQDLAKGGAVLLEGRHIDNECMRSQGRIQKAGGGGGGVLSVLGPIQKRGGGGSAVRFRPDSRAGGGGGGGAACRSMIYILVCARVRDSAWGGAGGGGGGGGGNWSQRAAFRMNGGGGRPPEPMLDPGLLHREKNAWNQVLILQMIFKSSEKSLRDLT